MSIRLTIIGCLAAATLAGCSKPQFAHREQVAALEPYAQGYVEQVLANYFGTPEEMVVWEKLPLDLHTGLGKFTAADEEQRTVTLEVAEPHHAIEPGTELRWLAESMKRSSWVKSWDETQHQAALETRLASLPEAGSEVIIGPGAVLARGRRLYAEHCQHCHGVSGDGAGPTAQYLNPRPRDYRRGVFKFTRTGSSPRPDRAQKTDLARIIEEGIPGTYMPSFKLLKKDEAHAIIEYVLWLSMRGEMEYQLVKFLSPDYSREAVKSRVDGGEKRRDIQTEFENRVNGGELAEELAGLVDVMIEKWTTSWQTDAVVTPLTPWQSPTPESIARGRALYLASAQGCVNCHGEAARGDGPQTYGVNKDFETGQDNPQVGLEDEWGQPIHPRNLHTGIYRGGRRPIDLYCRIYAGIKGSGMPAFGGKLVRADASGTMTDQDIWDLVNYIYSVPYEQEFAGSGKGVAGAPAMDQPAQPPADAAEPVKAAAGEE